MFLSLEIMFLVFRKLNTLVVFYILHLQCLNSDVKLLKQLKYFTLWSITQFFVPCLLFWKSCWFCSISNVCWPLAFYLLKTKKHICETIAFSSSLIFKLFPTMFHTSCPFLCGSRSLIIWWNYGYLNHEFQGSKPDVVVNAFLPNKFLLFICPFLIWMLWTDH